ncbi:MAG: hypothetical protein IMZ69_01765, partial [Spirochaetes bacterium]|nr:hypothetical protein [Spirochaetota bacterium]
MTTPTKTRYPRLLALDVASELVERLRPACERIKIAGSLRREKPDVGDIEILYVSKSGWIPDPDDFFKQIDLVLADDRIRYLESAGILSRRYNALGRETFGPLNKLMVHCASGIPVDLFCASDENWINYLVCRTGPADLN